MADRRLTLVRCSKGARRHRVKWFLQPLSADAKISRTPTAGGGPFAIDKTFFRTFSSAVSRPPRRAAGRAGI